MTPKHLTIAQEMLGLGPAAMAHALGISPETFDEWLSGRQTVPQKVCRCLELLLLHPETARRLAERRSDIGRTGAIHQLLSATPVRAKDAGEHARAQPGIYAIFVDKPATLGPELGNLLLKRKSSLLYIGVASESLRSRLIRQDFRGKGKSTFFQSIGAIWGYRPPAGSLGTSSASYRFDIAVSERIVERIEAHLYARWITDLGELSLADAERYAIREHRPILNIRHNPKPSPALKRLRAECRRIARSPRAAESTVVAA